MDTAEIVSILSSLRLGDKLAINDWKAKYTVCGLSPGYVLAHYGQHYTIISRRPTPEKYCFNGVRGNEIRCAPDWWIFGYIDGYQFTDEEWVHKYMQGLEDGLTEMSQKHHAPVYFLSVVGHTDKYWAKRKAPEGA